MFISDGTWHRIDFHDKSARYLHKGSTLDLSFNVYSSVEYGSSPIDPLKIHSVYLKKNILYVEEVLLKALYFSNVFLILITFIWKIFHRLNCNLKYYFYKYFIWL